MTFNGATLAEEIVRYRAKHNISMREMAEICQVSLQTIYSIENEMQEPSRLTREKIRMVLDKED